MRKRRLVALASVGALCGLAAGVVAGVGARVAMRMVADGVVDVVRAAPAFSVGGTLVIVLLGMVLGAPLGVLYAAIADRLPGPARLHGALFGLGLLAVVGPFFLRTEEFFSVGRVLLFVPLFVVFGLAIGSLHAPARALAPRLPLAAATLLALVPLACGALIVIALGLSLRGLPGGLAM